MSELRQKLKSDNTENLERKSRFIELETQPSLLDESQRLRTGIETIQNAFRSIRTEVERLADLSGIQLAEEDSSTESNLSSTSSQVAIDMAKHVIKIVARECQFKPIDT